MDADTEDAWIDRLIDGEPAQSAEEEAWRRPIVDLIAMIGTERKAPAGMRERMRDYLTEAGVLGPREHPDATLESP